MGGKHLKRLRAEKSKVHLKKKKICKEQNLTQTTFMVKKISTVDQLQKVEKDEPVSNWNIPLKDLLIRLNHYNFTTRQNGLIGIKELITKYPNIVRSPTIKTLINKLLELITDDEHKIRVTAIDLLSNVFDLMSPTSIVPFHKILNLHLGCAMTHRNSSVQKDSLKLIEVLIKHSPEAIKCNFKTITQNFLRIVKSYLYESYSGKFSTGKSKQEIEKGKIEILSMFYKFLVAGYDGLLKTKIQHITSDNIKVSTKEGISMRSLKDDYKKTPDLSVFQNMNQAEKLLSESDPKEFISLSSLIIPLIFDSWTDSFPKHKFNDFPSEYELRDVGQLLSVLLQMLLFLYETAKAMKDPEVENWFLLNPSSGFKQTFLSNFPFESSKNASAKKSKSSSFNEFTKENSNIDVMNNLSICYLAFSFKVIDRNSDLEKKIENYILDALTVKNTAEIEILSKVVDAGIHFSTHQISNNILCKVLEVFDVNCNSEYQQRLSKILMKVILEDNETIIQNDRSILKWMKTLPDRLCKSVIFVEDLETMLKIINTPKRAEILRELELKAGEIVKNLQLIKVKEMAQLEGQKRIVDILYRCENKVLKDIMDMNIWGKGMYHEDFENYILSVFSQKLTK